MSGATPRRVGFEFNSTILGGAEHFLHALARHLDRRLYTPVAIAPSAGPWQAFLDGVAETHVVPYLDATGAPADVAGALRRLDLDLVQSSYFAPVVALAALQSGIPHVWRLGGHVDALDRQWGEGEKSRLLAVVELTSRRIVCPSRYLGSQFAEASKALEVIYNGIDLAEVPYPNAEQGRSGHRVAMMAHLVPQKRHEIFLRAAAELRQKLPRARFFVLGGSYGTAELRSYEASLRELARDLGVDGVMELRQLGGDRFDTLRRIDVFALPGINEGASNVILEAMALARPVVAARSGGNPELIEDGVTGVLVPPEDPTAMASALLELLQDSEARRAMGLAARARVEREFGIQKCVRRYEQLYARVLAEG
jgi:glycosyltransferase involved in cell wall biosynthesis